MFKALAYHVHTLSLIKNIHAVQNYCLLPFTLSIPHPMNNTGVCYLTNEQTSFQQNRYFYYTHLCDYSHVTFFFWRRIDELGVFFGQGKALIGSQTLIIFVSSLINMGQQEEYASTDKHATIYIRDTLNALLVTVYKHSMYMEVIFCY